MQCGPYLIEGETMTRTRGNGKVITHYHYLPLPPALTIHSGDIIGLRVTGSPSAEMLRMEWTGDHQRIVATEIVPLRNGHTNRQYSLPASFDEYMSESRTLTIEIHAKGLMRCRGTMRVHPGD